jgi:hypothetical protein
VFVPIGCRLFTECCTDRCKNAGGGGPRLTGTSGGPTGVAATPKVDGQARKPDTPKTGHQVVRSFLVCRLIPIGTAAVRLHGPRLVCVHFRGRIDPERLLEIQGVTRCDLLISVH